MLRVVNDAGCGRIHKEKKMLSATLFIDFPRLERGMVWRDTLAWRGGGLGL